MTRVVLGRIAGPFGVRGWLKVTSFTDPPEQILDFACGVPSGRAAVRDLRPAEGRPHGKGFVVRLEGIDDRNAAIALGKPELWVERQELPALKKGEYYRGDLLGLEVVNLAGEILGRVDHFLDFPANPVMVVIGERERWLPAAPGRLLQVDLERTDHGRLGRGVLTDADRSGDAVSAPRRSGALRRRRGTRRDGGPRAVGLENPRSHAEDVHRTVDDRPFGGGPGMVLKASRSRWRWRAAQDRLPAGAPVIGLAAQRARRSTRRRRGGSRGCRASPWWRAGTKASTSASTDALIDEELSIGDYVLSGGEFPALIVIDAVARLLPGVLGDAASAAEDSFGDGLLDWPHYTRPEVWEGRPVPPVLLGGNHAAIRRWRLMQALGRTWQRRPDLLARRPLTPDERALLEEYCGGAGVEPPR